MAAPRLISKLGLCVLCSISFLPGPSAAKQSHSQWVDGSATPRKRSVTTAGAKSSSKNRWNLAPWDEGDSYSFAAPSKAVVTAAHLQLRVNFEQRVLTGSVNLQVERRDPAAERVVLDTRDLHITEITDPTSGTALDWKWGEPDRALGRPLFVHLPPGESVRVKIAYSTSANSTALAWLTPEQTAGRRKPYVFSQCQAIHCRSMVPLQDTPSVKMSYTAEITVPVGMTALMSALREGNETTGNWTTFRFRQPVPIPSYLIALAVGDLASRSLGERSNVWAEPELVDRAAHEFAETEQMLQLTETMLGPYLWGVYDLLVLPPSFPYGGMENPCLTFVTPALLVGDRSMTDVVAHEIIHSWIGNLVTNRNWEHSWLNEGFTMFLERKILGKLQGAPVMHLTASSGWKELNDTVQTIGITSPLTWLVPRLKGVDPEDAFSLIAYEKGHALLWYLEQFMDGSDQMEAFLKSYVNKHKYLAVDSGDFLSYLYEYFSKGSKDSLFAEVDWKAWFDSPGMPPYTPVFDTSLIDSCSRLRQQWVDWDETSPAPFSSADINALSTIQIIEFLSQLLEQPPLTLTKLKLMEQLYDMNARANAEIRYRWLRLCVRGRWKEQVPAVLEMVNTHGRLKYVRPLYRELYDWKEMRNRTIENYQNNKKYMMFVSVHTVAKDLNLFE
ncbi:leukotriene A-4 hydrolase-like [Amphibalanus amphitrite]|uniref:leukotriene A-4 hydrolase-like n=1 Tax=Amphibalanus amphitrite TaxID=1232801 RepID=UPI001C90D5F8|nr:leukotriene A-4 hydrolase-like [Amphibalanus amphitrite]